MLVKLYLSLLDVRLRSAAPHRFETVEVIGQLEQCRVPDTSWVMRVHKVDDHETLLWTWKQLISAHTLTVKVLRVNTVKRACDTQKTLFRLIGKHVFGPPLVERAHNQAKAQRLARPKRSRVTR